MTQINESLSATLDDETVTLYLFGAQVIEMTCDEFKQMAGVVLAEMEEV